MTLPKLTALEQAVKLTGNKDKLETQLAKKLIDIQKRQEALDKERLACEKETAEIQALDAKIQTLIYGKPLPHDDDAKQEGDENQENEWENEEDESDVGAENNEENNEEPDEIEETDDAANEPEDETGDEISDKPVKTRKKSTLVNTKKQKANGNTKSAKKHTGDLELPFDGEPAKKEKPKSKTTDDIIELLKNEPNQSMSVEKIAQKLGKSPSNIYVWFSNTGKISGVSRIGRGILGLTEPTE